MKSFTEEEEEEGEEEEEEEEANPPHSRLPATKSITATLPPEPWTVGQLITETTRRRKQLDDEKDETRTWFQGPPIRERLPPVPLADEGPS
jgi:hypothetical protein